MIGSVTIACSSRRRETSVRGAPIESEGELFEVGLQMLRRNRTLVSPEDPALEKTGDTMHAGHGDVSRVARFGEYGSSMPIAVLGEVVVATPAIRQHQSARRHHVAHRWQQSGG